MLCNPHAGLSRVSLDGCYSDLDTRTSDTRVARSLLNDPAGSYEGSRTGEGRGSDARRAGCDRPICCAADSAFSQL